MLGLKRGGVELHAHDEKWGEEARVTIEKLKALLGDIVRGAEHVGSTSIPTISAKPIIDIALAVDCFEDIIERADLLKEAGIYYRPSASDTQQLLLASGPFYEGDGEEQTHFIHVVKMDSEEWWGYLCFRDYLRLFEDVAKEYEEIKKALMLSLKTRAEYTAGKDEFITKVRERAMALRLLGKVVCVTVDRPKGTSHPDYPEMVYPINYGYIEGTRGGDGEPIDAYILGIHEPQKLYTGKVIGIIHRKTDKEDKLLVAPKEVTVTPDEARKQTHFAERYFDIEIYLLS